MPVNPDLVDPDVTPYPTENDVEENNNDDQIHSLPSADEVKCLQDFVEGEKKKNQRGGFLDFDFGLSRKQMYILGGLACLLFVVIIAMSAAIAQNNASARGNSRERAVVDFLSNQFADRTALEEPDSPQKQAARWIADEDELNMPLPASDGYEDAYKFVQRYALAVLYFAWAGKSEWIFDYQFLSKQDECDWNFKYQTGDSDDVYELGVKCNEDKEVDYLFMPGNGLEGTIPGEIGLLLALSHLSLFNNNLEGQLPVQMEYLTDLKFLAVEENQLTGAIPDWLALLTHMKFMALGGNKLTGEIPTSLTALTSLSEISLEDNEFEGSLDVLNQIPTLTRIFVGGNNFKGKIGHYFLADLPDLMELDISDNAFTGTIPHHFFGYEICDIHSNDIEGEIPSIERDDYPIKVFLAQNNGLTGRMHNSIANLQSLTKLDVSNNQLTAAIPSSIADMDQLQSLFLANNPFEEGPIPSIHNMTDLVELSLKGTNRVGPIHPWIGRELRALKILSLENNNLQGTVPRQIGHMKHLEYLLLNQNNLEGSLPDTLEHLHYLKMVRLDDNMLTGDASPICRDTPEKLDIFTSDCTGDDFACKCCSNCCEVPDDCGEAKLPENDISWKHGYPRNQAIFSEDLVFENLGNRR